MESHDETHANASTPTRLATIAVNILLGAAAATFLIDKAEAIPHLPPAEATSRPCDGCPASTSQHLGRSRKFQCLEFVATCT